MAQSSWWNPGRPRFDLDQVGLVIYPLNALRLHWAANYYRQLRREGTPEEDRESAAAQPVPDFGVLGGSKSARVLAVGSGAPDLVRDMGYPPQQYRRSVIDLDNAYERARRDRLRNLAELGGLKVDINPFLVLPPHSSGPYKGKQPLLLVTGERQSDTTGREWGTFPIETVAKLANLLIPNFYVPGQGWTRTFVVRAPESMPHLVMGNTPLVNMSFTMPGAEEALLAGAKSLTTRKSNFRVKEGGRGYTFVGNQRFWVQNLGYYNIDEAAKFMGSVNNYLAAEGMPPLPGGDTIRIDDSLRRGLTKRVPKKYASGNERMYLFKVTPVGEGDAANIFGASFRRKWEDVSGGVKEPPPFVIDATVPDVDWYGTFPEVQRLMTQRRNQSQWLANNFLHHSVRSRLFPTYMQVANDVKKGLRKPLDVTDPMPPPPLRDFPKLAEESILAAQVDGTLAEWEEKARRLTQPFTLQEKGGPVEYPPRWKLVDETFSVEALMEAQKGEKGLQQWFKNAAAVQKLPQDVDAPVIPLVAIRALAVSSFGVAKSGGEYERLDTYVWSRGEPLNIQLPNSDAAIKMWGVDKKGNTNAPLPFEPGWVAIVDLNEVGKINDKASQALRSSAYLDPMRRFGLVYGEPGEDGYFVIRNPSAAVAEHLLHVLMGVSFDHDSIREKWWFTPQPHAGNIFSFDIIRKTDSFKSLFAQMAGAAPEKAEAQVALDAYYKRMAFILMPPRSKASPEVRGGKVWQEAMGGPGTALVKVFPKGGGDRIAFKRDPDAIAVSEARPPKGTLYSGAARVYQEVSKKAQIPTHTRRESKIIDSEILDLLAAYNIKIPNLPVREKYPPGETGDEKFQAALKRYYTRVEKALAELGDSLSMRYEHEIPRHYRPREAEEEAYIPGPYDILTSSYLTKEEEGDSDAAEVREFREGMLMSFNPDDSYGRRERRPRRPRRERGERRLHTYFTDEAYPNPFDKDMVEEANELLEGVHRGSDLESAEAALESKLQKLREESHPEAWNLAQSTSLFPQPAGDKPLDSRAHPGRYGRMAKLTGFDLVSRLIHPPIGENVRELEREAPRFWEEEVGARAVTQQAELSLDQAKQIWQQQGKAYSSRVKRTIPASISVFKPIRVRRLKGYKIPSQVMDAVVDGKPLRNDVLIWVSPPEADRVRVMTYRKGSHLDADMVDFPAQNLTPSALIGRAIQSAMYWIGENFDRRARRGETRIVLGRIGDPRVNILWDPRRDFDKRGDLTLNLGIVQHRLGIGGAGAESKIIPGYEGPSDDVPFEKSDWGRDISHYLYEASRQPVGKTEEQKVAEAAEAPIVIPTRKAPPPPPPAPPEEGTAPPPPAPPEEGTAPLPKHIIEQRGKTAIFTEDVDKPLSVELLAPGALNLKKVGKPRGGKSDTN